MPTDRGLPAPAAREHAHPANVRAGNAAVAPTPRRAAVGPAASMATAEPTPPPGGPTGTADVWGWTLPLARRCSLTMDRPLVMAILNAPPDSFSDGGRLPLLGAGRVDAGRPFGARRDEAVEPAAPAAPAAQAVPQENAAQTLEQYIRDAIAAGADILDVGGESTRPGHAPVPAHEELRRVLPVIAAIRRVDPAIPVSIDTRKAQVAAAAIAAGADFVNDVSGLGDPAMAGVVREAGCAVVLMRNQPLARDAIAPSCAAELDALVGKARSAGLDLNQLILDPGVGFGDPPGGDVAANMALLTAGARHHSGRPVLVGASRKRFLGTMTGEPDASRRVGASVAAAILAVQSGAAIVRVHDVAATVQALKVLQHAPG